MARKSKKSSNGSRSNGSANGRVAALEKTLDALNKRFGEGSVMRLGDAQLDIESIPTGSLSLDIALGVGGVPRGRVIEIYGPESSGKTTLCQHIIAESQKTWWRLCLCRYGTCA